jgi:outer membrane protein
MEMHKNLNLVAAVVLAMQASAAGAETLSDALAGAYKTSNLLLQNQATLRASDENVAKAMAALRPVVSYIAQAVEGGNQVGQITGRSGQSATVDWVEQQNVSFTLSLQMTLYDFGKSKTNIAAARETVLSVEEQLRSVEQQVLLGAAQAYINVALQEHMVEMQQSNVELVNKDLAAAKDKFDVGEVTMTDVSQVEAQLAAAQSQLVASQGQLTLAREAYKAAVGHYPASLAPLPRAPALPKSLAEAQAIAAKTNPQILSAQHQSLAADLQAQEAMLATQPKISAGVNAGLTYYLNDNNTIGQQGYSPQDLSGEVQVGGTLYSGGQLSALYRQALNSQDAAKFGLAQSAVGVAQGVGNAWSNLSVAAASITASDQQVTAAQAALDGVRQEFAVGSRTTLDVLNAQQSVLSAESARLQAYANLYNGQYSLLSAMGLMTAEHLKLGVPIYDPKAYFNAIEKGPVTSPQGKKLDQIMKLMGRD